MQLSPKNPKVKNRMDRWHVKGSHTPPENAPKEKESGGDGHIATLKRGFGVIFDGLKSLGSEENLNRLGELGRNAGNASREMGLFELPGDRDVKRKRRRKKSRSRTRG